MTGYGGADRSYFWQNVPPISEREINNDFQGGVIPNKAYLNIVPEKDTLDASILKGMPYGRNQSEANKPTLEFPIYLLREAKVTEQNYQKEYEEIRKNLSKYLPKEFYKKLKTKKDNLVFLALEKTLYYFSQIIFSLSKTALRKTYKPNYPIHEMFKKNILDQGNFIINEGEAFLIHLTRNDPDYDVLFLFFKNLSEILNKIKRNEDIYPYFLSFANEYEKKGNMKEFQIIGSILKNIDVFYKSLTVDKKLQRLLYSLLLSESGVTNTETALFPKDFEIFFNELLQVSQGIFEKELSSGQNTFLSFLLKISFLLSSLCSLNLIKSTYIPHESEEIDLLSGKNIELDAYDLEMMNFYCVENFIIIFIEFNLLTPFLDSIEKNISFAWEAFTLISIIQILKIHYWDATKLLVSHLKEIFLERLPQLESIFQRNNDYQKGTAILAICQEALKTNDYEQFFELLTQFFESMGISSQGSWENFYHLADTFKIMFSDDLQDLRVNFTDVVQI